MTSTTALFGPELVSKGGKTVKTADALAGKVVGIYFSAHWCPPCRGFTPRLAQYYETYKAKGLDFEIVFVSSDRDQSAFDAYFGEMPWLALPHSDRARKGALSQRYKVEGIPTLIIVDADGATITADGRAAVSEDPEGDAFPWKPKPLSEILGGDLALDGKDGAKVPIAELASKHLLLYFSAHWCPPCRRFTPMLAEHYKAYKAKGLELEVVFVSSDQDQSAFSEYFGEMPWLALPYADRARSQALDKAFEIQGIPSLVVIGPADATGERKVVNKNARGAVGDDASGAEFPWAPQPLENLAATPECNGSAIWETPALVALIAGCDEKTQAAVEGAMRTVAAEIAAAGRDSPDGPAAICFYTREKEGFIGSCVPRDSLKPSPEPTLLMIDIPDNGSYYVCTEEVTESAIRSFFESYTTGALKGQRKQLKQPSSCCCTVS